MNFVDIHTHILPGVDDGAQSLEDTLVMLRIAYDSGTRRMVATPHMFLDLFNNNDFLEIRDRFEALIRDLNSYQEKQPHIKEMDLYLGAENYASPEFLEALGQGCVLTLNGSRYLLVEVSPALPMSQIGVIMENVLAADYTPVIAHVERYAAVQQDPSQMERLRNLGCVLQVNARSLAGEHRDPKIKPVRSGSFKRVCWMSLPPMAISHGGGRPISNRCFKRWSRTIRRRM
jgi:protein-tyrosine phosphatase